MTSLLTSEIINYNISNINYNINNNNINIKFINHVNKNISYDISSNNINENNIDLFSEYKLNNFYFNPNKNSPPDEWRYRLEKRIKKFNNKFL
tara:strand:- start:312 stop:590 length:279 start_codon:yes stop_codon:yes gene_type:complete